MYAIRSYYAPGHVPGVVAVPVELQGKERRTGGARDEMPDEGIRAALEVRDVDDVELRVGPAPST